MTEPFQPAPGVQVVESRLEVSDGVSLRLFEFSPPAEDDQGPVIVFVPGWISSIQAWQSVLEVLTPQYRVVYVETREKISARPPAGRVVDFSVDRLADDICEILDAKVPPGRPFCFMGSSLGSTVLLECLSRRGRQPLVALLIGPRVAYDPPLWLLPAITIVPTPFLSILKPVLKWYLCAFLVDEKKEPEQAARYCTSIDLAEPRRLRASVRALDTYSGWEGLSSITAPVVIISAKTDKLHPSGDVDEIASEIPNARLELMASNRDTHSTRAGLLALEEITKATASAAALGSVHRGV